MKLQYDGLIIDSEIIGGFKINEKEYAVCSYADSNNNYKIVIVEVVRDGKELKTKKIPADEIDFVLSRYKELEKEILGGENYE